jgi:hypothetical protein
MNVRPTSHRSVTSVEYDEYDATIRVSKGVSLARSRVTPGAHRGFTHSGDRRMEHAEIFLKGQRGQERAPVFRTWVQEELYELLRPVLQIVLVEAAEATLRHIKRWRHEQTPAFTKAPGDGLRERQAADDRPWPNEPGAVVQAAFVQGPEKFRAFVEEDEPSSQRRDGTRFADGRCGSPLIRGSRTQSWHPGGHAPSRHSAFRAS